MLTSTAHHNQFGGSRRWLTVLATGAALALAGCVDHAEKIREVERHNAELRGEVRRQREELVKQQAINDDLRAGITGLQRFGERDISKLYRVSDVHIGRLSGGWDKDGVIGDEGVTVYLRLLDEEGQAFKAAGSLDVIVMDLEHGTPRAVASCAYDVDQARSVWYGQMLTYHYKIRCPWSDGPPSGRTVMVRVTFTDYLTGQPYHAVQTLEITPALDTADSGE